MAFRFDWDDWKLRKNLRDHEIHFDDAALVFDDPYCITQEDSVDEGELRWRTIGIAFGIMILLVVHVDEDLEKMCLCVSSQLERPRRVKAMTMTRVARRKQGDPVSPESIARLKKLAETPNRVIRTDLIPEQRFDVALARERREAGWTPGKPLLKKAS